jgi:hypothetical protein
MWRAGFGKVSGPVVRQTAEWRNFSTYIQGDQKFSVHLIITIQKPLPHYLVQSDCFAADRQGQGDTIPTLTLCVIPNSNYVIMVNY